MLCSENSKKHIYINFQLLVSYLIIKVYTIWRYCDNISIAPMRACRCFFGLLLHFTCFIKFPIMVSPWHVCLSKFNFFLPSRCVLTRSLGWNRIFVGNIIYMKIWSDHLRHFIWKKTNSWSSPGLPLSLRKKKANSHGEICLHFLHFNIFQDKNDVVVVVFNT